MSKTNTYDKFLEGRDKREAAKDPFARLHKARTERLEKAFLAEDREYYDDMIEDQMNFEETSYIIN